MKLFLGVGAALATATFAWAGEHAGPHWSYSGEGGPEHWGDLDASFAACKTGKEQSPVDLRWKKPRAGHSIVFRYQAAPLKAIDNGHTIQVNFAPGSEIAVEGRRYELVQLHFHSASEHTFSRRSFPLEAHFVHKDAEGKLAVVGVMFEQGERNPALARIWENLPKETGHETAAPGVEIDPASLLPEKRTHYHYLGSLTTPPCTEGVSWNVMNTTLEASSEQIAAFRRIYAGNNRPVQPLHDRRPANH